MKAIYAWNQWFAQPSDEDGKTRLVLTAGVHYHCSQTNMAQVIRNAASRFGLRVNVLDMDDRFLVVARQPLRAA